MTFQAISYGGGVQSTAMIVLAIEGRIEADVALFANVGDRAEHPGSLAYVRDVAAPWAAERGFAIHEVQRRETLTNRADLYDTMADYAGERLKEPIPLRAPNGAPMGRSCTADWKVKAVQQWLTEQGHVPATSLIGISVDEIERAGRGKDTNENFPRAYPLLALGLNRFDCERVIADAGLPVPGKSSCYFCPYHKPQVWAEMRRDEPELFAQSQELEDLLNARRVSIGVDQPVYLSRFGKRLSEAIPEAQASLFGVGSFAGADIGEDGCDEGVCFV